MSSKPRPRKSWQQKLADDQGLPRVEPITGKMTQRWGSGTFVIPAPREVDEVMGKVPRGKLITVTEIRDILALKHGASLGCPLTTGIFIWVAAHAAEEAAAEGKKNITPYWRTLKSGGLLHEKYPGGIEAQAARLREEGHTIEPGKGKRPPKVKDYEKHLVEL